MSELYEIIAEACEKYTVHNCGQCEFRKSCNIEFDSNVCKDIRQSIMLGFGIENGYFTKLLDRLEAARKRERGATCEKSSQVGNNAKMREAVEQINRIVWDKHRHTKEETEAHRLATEALSAPPRNCDVGTEGEQSRRFDKFCYAHKTYERGCGDCPLCLAVCCELAWAQMPYEEGAEI